MEAEKREKAAIAKKQAAEERARVRELNRAEEAIRLEQQRKERIAMYGHNSDSDVDEGEDKNDTKSGDENADPDGGGGGGGGGGDDPDAEENPKRKPAPKGKEAAAAGKGAKGGKAKKGKKSGPAEEIHCPACNKTFKNENQWINHEKSKAHKLEVARLKVQVFECKLCGEGPDAPLRFDTANQLAKHERSLQHLDRVAAQEDEDGDEGEDVCTGHCVVICRVQC